MTPLYNKLSQFLPPKMVLLGMIAIYTSLIIMIVTFLIPPGHFDLVYLDLGK
jgi:hypothetical protein